MNIIDFLRQFRIGEYAVFDFVVSFIGFYLLAPLLSKLFLKIRLNIPKQNWLWLALPIGMIIHAVVGSFTPMTINLFDIHDHYILKIIMLILLIAGLKGIKIVKNK